MDETSDSTSREASSPPDTVGSNAAAGTKDVPWWEDGADPDYRFSLANERTFLAWIRTALAFIAAAVALEQLVPSFTVHGVRTALSVVLAVFGLVAGAGAYRHWMRSERAMRRGEALPRTPLMLVLSIGLVVVAAVIAVVLVVQAA